MEKLISKKYFQLNRFKLLTIFKRQMKSLYKKIMVFNKVKIRISLMGLKLMMKKNKIKIVIKKKITINHKNNLMNTKNLIKNNIFSTIIGPDGLKKLDGL